MDMMNAMVAMSLGAGQAEVHLVPSGRAETEGMSFARSFDEGVGLAVDAKAGMAAALPDSTKGAAVTISDDLVGMPGIAKAKAVADQTVTFGMGDGKNAAAAKSVSVGKGVDATAVSSYNLRGRPTFGKALTEASGIDNAGVGKMVAAEAGAHGKRVANEVGPVQSAAPDGKVDAGGGDVTSAQSAVPAAQVENASSVVQDVAQLARPTVHRVAPSPQSMVLSPDAESAAKQEIEGAGIVKPELHAKNAAKGEEGTAEVKTAHKAASVVENVPVTVARTSTMVDAQLQVVSLSAGTAFPVGRQQEGAGKVSESNSTVLVPAVVEARAGAVPVPDANRGKENLRPGKVAVEDGKPAVMAAGESDAPSKSRPEFAKTIASAAPSPGDSDGKMQSSTAGVLHAVVGATGAVSGPVAGVASAHVVGATAAAKLQSGDFGGHAAMLHAASGEMHEPGVMTASSMDGAHGAHRTLMATPTALEVGIADGTNGWLKIRAEMAGGGVNATVSAASQAGQQMLHRELPSLTAYLQQEHVAVNTVVVHTSVAGTEARGVAGGAEGDASGQAQQRDGQGGDGPQGRVDAGVNYTDETPFEGLDGVGADGLLPLTYTGGGSWLSVRA